MAGPVEYSKGDRNGADPFSVWHNVQALTGQQDAYTADQSLGRGTQQQTAVAASAPLPGMVSRSVQTVAVDPFTGNPIRVVAKTDPTGDSKSWGEFEGMRDDTPYAVRRLPDTPYGKPKVYVADAVNPLDVSRLGLTNDPFRVAADKAAEAEGAGGVKVTVNGGGPFSGHLVAGALHSNMAWQPAVSGTGAGWSAADRQLSPAPMAPGMVVGTPTPTVRSVIAARQSAPAAVQVISPEVHAALMAQQSPDQRGIEAARASGMIDQFGMLTGSGGHSMWGSH